MGGDDTTAIDGAVEAAVIARLDASGLEFTLVSEELGRRGDGTGVWVVLDPIDGSINAKRGLPFFSLSIAIAEGGTMDDVASATSTTLRHRRGMDGRTRRWRTPERQARSSGWSLRRTTWSRPRSASTTWRSTRTTSSI
jgi:hypothetical protein